MKRALIIYLLVTIPILLIGERNNGLFKATRRSEADQIIREQMEWQCPMVGFQDRTNDGSDGGNDGNYDYRAVRKVDDNQEVSAEAIRSFLAKYHSPLEAHAEVFVSVGREHSIDPRLLVALSGCESTFGKNGCGFNPFGWDSCRSGFSDYPTAISTVGRTLAQSKAYQEWREDKEDLFKLAKVYTGTDGIRWEKCVRFFLEEINETNK